MCIEILPVVISPQKEIVEYIYLYGSVLLPAISIFLSVLMYAKTNKSSQLQKIYEQNNYLLALAMRYPYLEDYTFCADFDGEYDNPKKIRYNLYCAMIFNLIVMLYEFSGKDSKKMDNILGYKEYILDHRKWWEIEIPKTGGYDDDFIFFINSALEEKQQ